MDLPLLPDVLHAAAVVALPMRVPFRGVRVREAVLLHGPAGWGEFAPFAEYDDAESAAWLAAGLEAAWTGWPRPLRPRVSVNATVPAVGADAVPAVLARFPGCTTAKVKVAQRGQSTGDDVARVAAVRAVLGDAGSVRVDANGAWSVEDAVAALTALARQGPLEYAEQPCGTVAELVALRERLAAGGVRVPVAADESIRRATDPLAVVRAGAADVAVLKVAPLGGVRAVVALAERLRAEHGVPVVLSSALDTSVGIGAGLAAAAALPEGPASGLATGSLLAADVTAPRALVGGAMDVGAVVPDADRLAALAAPPERREWWWARLRRCHAVLAAARC